MKKILSTLCLIIFFSGCAQQTFMLSSADGQLKESNAQHFFVNGIGQSKEVNAAKVCGDVSKVAKVEVQQTFVNGIFSFITMGIYSPREARVFCK